MRKMGDIVAASKVAIMLFVVVLVGFPQEVAARRTLNSNWLVWGSHVDRIGRYSGQYLYVARGFNVTVGANYYYGDIDGLGMAFKGGFRQDNFRGAVTLTYQHPIWRYFNLRSSFSVGSLHGNTTQSYPKQFQSIYLEPSICFDYYPFAPFSEWGLGLYIFAGVSAATSIIHYNFDGVEGDAFRVLPMVPFGIGWAFPIGRYTGLMAHLEVSAHQGLMDTPHLNLDAYPMNANQNSAGRDFGKSIKPETGKPTNEAGDGFFQVGITLSYRWK